MAGIALDTNLLVYAEGLQRSDDDAAKIFESRRLLRRFLSDRLKPVVALQSLAELHRVLVRRGGESSAAASAAVQEWLDRVDVVESSEATFSAALELSSDHHLQIFDALILAAAASAGCSALLSEDLHAGFVWRGVAVVNPFQAGAATVLDRLLG